MKTKPVVTILALSFALVAVFTLSACKTRRDTSSAGMHTMGSPKTGYPMRDQDMPGAR